MTEKGMGHWEIQSMAGGGQGSSNGDAGPPSKGAGTLSQTESRRHRDTGGGPPNKGLKLYRQVPRRQGVSEQSCVCGSSQEGALERRYRPRRTQTLLGHTQATVSHAVKNIYFIIGSDVNVHPTILVILHLKGKSWEERAVS